MRRRAQQLAALMPLLFAFGAAGCVAESEPPLQWCEPGWAPPLEPRLVEGRDEWPCTGAIGDYPYDLTNLGFDADYVRLYLGFPLSWTPGRNYIWTEGSGTSIPQSHYTLRVTRGTETGVYSSWPYALAGPVTNSDQAAVAAGLAGYRPRCVVEHACGFEVIGQWAGLSQFCNIPYWNARLHVSPDGTVTPVERTEEFRFTSTCIEYWPR